MRPCRRNPEPSPSTRKAHRSQRGETDATDPARLRYAARPHTKFLTVPGHTLSGQIEQVERLTGITVERAYVDRGYKGHKHGGKAKVYIAHTRGIASPTIKRELRRRNAIEPIIGHTKSDGLLERNHLAGATGDAINAILVAAGHNLRLLVAWLNALLRALLTAWIPVARREMAAA